MGLQRGLIPSVATVLHLILYIFHHEQRGTDQLLHAISKFVSEMT
jgi:hypothetical protein